MGLDIGVDTAAWTEMLMGKRMDKKETLSAVWYGLLLSHTRFG
jgi:hypothetical protein